MPNQRPGRQQPPSVPADPGEKQAIIADDLGHVWHPMIQHQALAEKPPAVMTHAEGSRVTDADGKTYLDAMAGLYCVNVGYGRQELTDAAHQQLQELPYYPHTQINAPAARFSARLSKAAQGAEYHTYFVNSGSEANEAMFKLARQYHKNRGQPGRYKIVGRYYAYHGTTLAALAAGGMAHRRQQFEPLPQGFIHVAPPYCYRCPFGLSYPSCDLACAKNLDFTLAAEGPETVAAVVVEPVMSGVGVLPPPPDYLAEVEKACRNHGVLLAVDEVINGFGRTGKMFGFQHYGIEPDFIQIAKGISSAYIPLAATMAIDRVFEAFLGDASTNRHAVQVNTYGGHPVATAVGLANLDLIETEALADNAAAMGEYMLDRLRNWLEHPQVGDVRGLGLLIGIEFVADKRTKAPLSPETVNRIAQWCMDHGLIVGKTAGTVVNGGNTLVLAPPLILQKAEADEIIDIFSQAIAAVLG